MTFFSDRDCEQTDLQVKEVEEREHCHKLSYVVEENGITTRCPGNCACCKAAANSKQSNFPISLLTLILIYSQKECWRGRNHQRIR